MELEFIEVTEITENVKILLPVKNILSVSEQNSGNCFIETNVDKDGVYTGIEVKETYFEILSLLSVSNKILKFR